MVIALLHRKPPPLPPFPAKSGKGGGRGEWDGMGQWGMGALNTGGGGEGWEDYMVCRKLRMTPDYIR